VTGCHVLTRRKAPSRPIHGCSTSAATHFQGLVPLYLSTPTIRPAAIHYLNFKKDAMSAKPIAHMEPLAPDDALDATPLDSSCTDSKLQIGDKSDAQPQQASSSKPKHTLRDLIQVVKRLYEGQPVAPDMPGGRTLEFAIVGGWPGLCAAIFDRDNEVEYWAEMAMWAEDKIRYAYNASKAIFTIYMSPLLCYTFATKVQSSIETKLEILRSDQTLPNHLQSLLQNIEIWGAWTVRLRGDSCRRADVVAWPSGLPPETFVAEITYNQDSSQEDLQAIAEQYLFESRAIMTVLLFSIDYNTRNMLQASATSLSEATFQVFKRDVQNGTAKAVTSGPTTFRNASGVVNPHKGLVLYLSDFFVPKSRKDQAAYDRNIFISNQELSNALATAEYYQAAHEKGEETYIRRKKMECKANEQPASQSTNHPGEIGPEASDEAATSGHCHVENDTVSSTEGPGEDAEGDTQPEV
jgi:hypothetical protein